MRRTRSKTRAPPPPPELSYAEQMRIEALQEYQKRLAEPLAGLWPTRLSTVFNGVNGIHTRIA